MLITQEDIGRKVLARNGKIRKILSSTPDMDHKLTFALSFEDNFCLGCYRVNSNGKYAFLAKSGRDIIAFADEPMVSDLDTSATSKEDGLQNLELGEDVYTKPELPTKLPFEHECITTNSVACIDRSKVIGGWLIILRCGKGCAMQFISDPFHKWEITNGQ